MSGRRPLYSILIFAGIALMLSVLWPTGSAGTVRIGVNHSPPYAVVEANGSLSGFSVEILREAARRRGIRLQWIVVPEGSEPALKSGKVDIWYLYTDFPERHRFSYFTDPWLRLKYSLIVRESSPIRSLKDTVGRRIAYFPGPSEARLIPRLFPRSAWVQKQAGQELEPICTGDADAALIEIKSTVTRLLQGPLACGAVALRLLPLEGASFQMAIGATHNGIAAAKNLRAEISNLAKDRTLDRLHQRWFQFTSDETSIVNELSESRERSRRFLWGSVILLGVVVLLAVFIRREHRSRQFASAVLDSAGGLLIICDARGRVVQFNRACREVLGKTFLEIRGREIWKVLVPPDEQVVARSTFSRLAKGDVGENAANCWHAPDGRRLLSWSNTVLLNRSGRVDYIIGNGIDISAHEAAEEKLGYEATHDSLTGLINRRQIMRELTGAMFAARERGETFRLAFADLDHFKLINDTYGHEAGDAVLIYLADVLREELQPVDLAGRLGGDEFCMLIRSPDADATMERIIRHLRRHQFLTEHGQPFHASLTIGLATYGESMRQPSDILRVADAALYQAKRFRPPAAFPLAS